MLCKLYDKKQKTFSFFLFLIKLRFYPDGGIRRNVRSPTSVYKEIIKKLNDIPGLFMLSCITLGKIIGLINLSVEFKVNLFVSHSSHLAKLVKYGKYTSYLGFNSQVSTIPRQNIYKTSLLCFCKCQTGYQPSTIPHSCPVCTIQWPPGFSVCMQTS